MFIFSIVAPYTHFNDPIKNSSISFNRLLQWSIFIHSNLPILVRYYFHSTAALNIKCIMSTCCTIQMSNPFPYNFDCTLDTIFTGQVETSLKLFTFFNFYSERKSANIKHDYVQFHAYWLRNVWNKKKSSFCTKSQHKIHQNL